MSEMTGRLRDLTRNLDGTWNLTVTVDQDCRGMFDDLRDKDIDVEVKKHRHRRSLDANAYCWTLISKIAAKMSIDKVEVYREAIRSIGGVSQIVCVKDKAAGTLCRMWNSRGIGWQSEVLPSKIPGCANVVLHWGSSEYDSAQMSLLIDHVVQDAKGLGIETLTPRELEGMLSQWEAYCSRKKNAS